MEEEKRSYYKGMIRMKNIETAKTAGGYTIIEMLVCMVIGIILLGVLGTIMMNMYNSLNRVESVFDMEKGLEDAAQALGRDFSETNLNSIIVYPDLKDSMPGVSMISAEVTDSATGERKFGISRFGTPLWSGHVFYTVVPSKPRQCEVGSPFEGKLGNLVRWHLPFDREKNPVYPFPTEIFPSDFSKNNASVKIIARGVPLPDAPELQGMDFGKVKGKNCGGFRVSFIRQSRDEEGKVLKETLSDINPALAADGEDMAETSPLVQVDITIVHFSERDGKMTAFSFPIQVAPMN